MIYTHPPLVMIHGWAAHGGYFTAAAEHLRERAAVYAPDLPGYGTQATGKWQPTIESTADWLADYLDRQQLDKVVLCGWSMGAHVVLSYLKQWGESRVSAAILVDMTAKILNDEHWHLGLKSGLSAEANKQHIEMIKTTWPALAQRSAIQFFAETIDDSTQATSSNSVKGNSPLSWVKKELQANNAELLANFWRSMSQQDFRSFLPGIQVPTLIISGGRSRLYETAAGDYLAQHIHNSCHVILDQSGHSPHMEQPEAFSQAIEEFLSGLG